MIAGKFVDLYARDSGLRDKLVAERDVVLTYALQALCETGVMDALAFKGGTCLRKTVFGNAGRFSEDLDFTLDTDLAEDDALADLVEAFNKERHGVGFTFEDYYKTDDGASFGGDVRYRHDWNDAGRFRLQVSLRERPTLPPRACALQAQGYFAHMEFDPPAVRSLRFVEMLAEKLRAACQRSKVRDLYDLHQCAALPFDGALLRKLVVLKLWQVRDRFDPEAMFRRFRSGRYDWADVERLLRRSARIDPESVVSTVETRFAALRDISALERRVADDAPSGWNAPLAERLRAEIRQLAGR